MIGNHAGEEGPTSVVPHTVRGMVGRYACEPFGGLCGGAGADAEPGGDDTEGLANADIQRDTPVHGNGYAPANGDSDSQASLDGNTHSHGNGRSHIKSHRAPDSHCNADTSYPNGDAFTDDDPYSYGVTCSSPDIDTTGNQRHFYTHSHPHSEPHRNADIHRNSDTYAETLALYQRQVLVLDPGPRWVGQRLQRSGRRDCLGLGFGGHGRGGDDPD